MKSWSFEQRHKQRWVSRFAVLWVTGPQPAALCWTSPDTPYRSDWNPLCLFPYMHETTSYAAFEILCEGVSACVSSCIAVFLLSRRCFSDRGRGTIGVVSTCIMPSLAAVPPKRVLCGCHNKLLSSPHLPTVRIPHPLDSQMQPHPIRRVTTIQNDTFRVCKRHSKLAPEYVSLKENKTYYQLKHWCLSASLHFNSKLRWNLTSLVLFWPSHRFFFKI